MLESRKDFIANVIRWQRGGRLFKIQIISLFCLFLVSASYGTNYYVSTKGKNTNNGLSEGNAWRTIAYAGTKAKAGDIVYVKSGLYSAEHINLSNSGTSGNPIVYQGYQNTPGDSPIMNYTPGGTLDSTMMPLIKGALTWHGFYITGKSYIEIRNFGIDSFSDGMYLEGNANHITIENVYATNNTSAGFFFTKCSYITIKNCIATDNEMVNFIFDNTHYSLADKLKSYAVAYDLAVYARATDYHIQLRDAHDNIVQNSLAYNLHDAQTSQHPGHGIGIKDYYYDGSGYKNPHSYNNKFINCEARNMGENFYVAHEAYNNVFESCTVKSNFRKQNSWNQGISLRDGAHDNIFRNMRIEGVRTCISILETVEGPTTVQRCTNNIITNSQFTDSYSGLQLMDADNNLIKNCVFDSTASWVFAYFSDPTAASCSGNVCRNSIVTNIKGDFISDPYKSGSVLSFSYSNFWNNKFSMPSGTGNIAVDPKFVDRVNRDYHLKSTKGHWNKGTSTWVLDGETSPCIDKGQPTDDCTAEPSPNGNAINMGTYGGTLEASMSPAKSESSIGTTTGINTTSEVNTQDFTIYPNPFSVSSTIKYSSTIAGHVNIVIFDIQGRQIRNLLDEKVQPGSLNIQWDGTNSAGQKVINGVYFLKLMTDYGFTKTQKVLFKQ
jgi:parallel beta-helix repeat protein